MNNYIFVFLVRRAITILPHEKKIILLEIELKCIKNDYNRAIQYGSCVLETCSKLIMHMKDFLQRQYVHIAQQISWENYLKKLLKILVIHIL